MSGNVFVVQEAPTGRWIAACCDERCCYGMHTVADTDTKHRAEAAATRHRRYLQTLPTYSDKPRKDECERCGQSTRTITELQGLVTELEARLAAAETAQTTTAEGA